MFKRDSIQISYYDFMRFFKDEGERCYYIGFHDSEAPTKLNKLYPKSYNSLFLKEHETEYVLQDTIKNFHRIQKDGYGVFFYIHSSIDGVKLENITRINSYEVVNIPETIYLFVFLIC